MKKTLSLLLSLLLLLPLLASCSQSAYDHPEDYVSLPALSTITVKNADVEETMEDLKKDILDNLSGEYFLPVTEPSATAKLGDKVAIRYEGSPTDPTVTLTDEVKTLLKEDSSEGYGLIIGSGTLPAAFENALIGAKAGDSVTLTLTYGEDDTDIEALIGVELRFDVEILSIARLTVGPQHSVNLKFTAALAHGAEPLDTILTLLSGAVETVDLADAEDTFNSAFTVDELMPHLLGHNKYDVVTFTLTLDPERAASYGYDTEVAIDFTATINEITETPTEITDELVKSFSGGAYTSAEAYLDYCRDMVKEDLALQAISKAATFSEDYPEEEYQSFYVENYNAAVYSTLGDVSGYTTEQLEALMTPEITDKIEQTARENTLIELNERLLLEYLYDLLDVTLSDKEYSTRLAELYDTYYTSYYYMMVYYGVDSPEKLEEYLGKDYVEVQFKYEKLLPLLKYEVTYVD